MKDKLNFNRLIFWIIIFTSIMAVMVMFSISIGSQVQSSHSKATLIAHSTMTVEFIETHYQKGLGYINIGRWLEAKREFELVFELDPNYKDVQAKLVEIYDEIAELNPVFTPVPTVQFIEINQTNNENSPKEITSQNIVSQDGLVAYFPFNGNANDKSGNNNHGTVYGAIPKMEKAGPIFFSYQFDGIDDVIKVNDAAALRPLQSLTVAAWVKPDRGDYGHEIISKRYREYDFPYNSYILNSTNDNKWQFCVSTEYIQTCIHDQDVVVPNTWTHLVGVYDGENIILYVNGIAKASQPKTKNIVYSSLSLRIGQAIPSQQFLGQISDVRIYDRPLSITEVQTMYANVK